MKFVDSAASYFKTPSWVAKKKIHEAKALTNKPGYRTKEDHHAGIDTQNKSK